MQINWKVRLLSVKFWLALVPAVLLVVQSIASVFGYKWDFVVLNQQIAAVINSVFAVLAILGVVTDPTTAGIGDSDLVMSRVSQLSVGKQSVQVPNPNPQGQPIAETPLIVPVDSTTVSHETTPESGASGNAVQH